MKEFWMRITKVDGKQITAENLTDPDQPLPDFTFSEDHGFKVGDKIHMTDEIQRQIDFLNEARKYPLPSLNLEALK